MPFPDIPVPVGTGAAGDCDAILQSEAIAAGILNFSGLPDLAQLQLAVANVLASGLNEITYTVPTGPSAPGDCHSAMLSSAAALGITGLQRLPQMAQLQIVVANLLANGITPSIAGPEDGGSIGHTSAALVSAAARRGLQVQRLPALAQLQIATANLVAVVSGGGGGGEVDASLQPFVDGDYTDLEFYASQRPPTGTLLAQTTVTGAVINSPTSITINVLDPTPEILATSDDTEHKWGKYSGVGQPDKYFSLGESGAPFGPNLVVGDMNWYAADHIDLNGTLTVSAETDEVDHYEVEVSTETPESGGTYTSTAQAVDALDAVVNRIGLELTVSVVGDGGGTIDPTTTFTDRTGLSGTLTNTAGDAEEVEVTHVTDGTHTGDGPNVTPFAANVDLVLTVLASGALQPAGTNPSVSAEVTIPAGGAMLVGVLSIAHETPVATGLTFSEDAHIAGSLGGQLSLYCSGKIAGGFTNTVSFPNNGQNLTYIICKLVPASPVTTIAAVAANTAEDEDASGVPEDMTIAYPQAFSDTHNLGVSLWGNYGPRAASARLGWTEPTDGDVTLGNDGNPFGLEIQSKLGGDTAGSAEWGTPLPVLVYGAITEYAAVP